MSHLRQQMTELMILCGFAKSTQDTYLHQISQLAKYFNRSPDLISEEDIRQYMLHCHLEKHWAHSSCRQFIHAARFLFDRVLERPISKKKLSFPKKETKIPELLSRSEVQRIIEHCQNEKHKTALMVTYATGIRVSELTALKVSDLDGERSVIKIRAGKGKKDRFVDFTDGLKQCLRVYWHEFRPIDYLFYSYTRSRPYTTSTFQRAFLRAKRSAKIQKQGGIHALRHAYATHQLEDGMPLPQLQQMLGHKQISCTLRYTHWVRCTKVKSSKRFDLLVPKTPKKPKQ